MFLSSIAQVRLSVLVKYFRYLRSVLRPCLLAVHSSPAKNSIIVQMISSQITQRRRPHPEPRTCSISLIDISIIKKKNCIGVNADVAFVKHIEASPFESKPEKM
ncbi:hypothetical protein PUN28_002704 [Cardiocondyla obscurior]|uniref:Uncharacterized protein n=1 Tax=Cardiocondyla obscurior TaxID=286306 RepID=A0AAW2GVN8_9HYME